MTLGTRIAVIAAGAVAVAVIAASVLAYVAARDQLLEEVDASLADRAAQLAGAETVESLFRNFQPRGGFRRGGPVGPLPVRSFDALYYQVIDASGIAIAPPGQEVALPIDDVDLDVVGRRRPTVRSVSSDGVHLRMITFPAGRDDAIQVARPLTEVDNTLRGLAAVLVGVGLVGAAGAAALGLVVARNALAPLRRLGDAAERVAETHELGERIEIERDDEIGRLATSFNSMLTALDEAQKLQQRLVRDAGHELRTPLTALRTNIDVLARAESLAEPERRTLLADASRELEELSTLVAEVVDLAAESRIDEEPVSEVRLDELVARVVARYRRRATTEIHVESAPTTVTGKPGALERAIGNLVDNAVKWNRDGRPIEVTVAGSRVMVRDHGPGIPPGERARVFERFYRAPVARSAPGSGLGLAIVKRIVDAHGGRVFVDEADGGGAIVGFELPSIEALS